MSGCQLGVDCIAQHFCLSLLGGGGQAPNGRLHSLQCLSKSSCFDCIYSCAAAAFNWKAVSGETASVERGSRSYSACQQGLKPSQARVSHLCLFPFRLKTEKFSASHPPGTSSFCVKIVDDKSCFPLLWTFRLSAGIADSLCVLLLFEQLIFHSLVLGCPFCHLQLQHWDI